MIKTADGANSTHRPYAFPERGILHDDAVFGVHGAEYVSRRWQDLPAQ